MSKLGKSRWDVSGVPFVDSNNGQWSISVELKAVNGRIVPIAILIEPQSRGIELKSETLREIGLQNVIQTWAKREHAQLLRSNKNRRVRPHRGRRHSDDELKTVADIYLAAAKKSLPVQQIVASTMGISISTAGKRIMAARRIGLIPPAKGNSR